MNSDAMTILRDGQERFFADPPDYQAACSMFARVTKLRPDWIEGHHWLAVSHEALGQISDAEAAYRTATQCDAEDPRPQVSLGRLLLNAGRFREAIRELERGVKLKHHYAEADSRLFLADAYEAAGERAKARAEWSRISKMEGFYPSYDEPMKEARRKLAQTKP